MIDIDVARDLRTGDIIWVLEKYSLKQAKINYIDQKEPRIYSQYGYIFHAIVEEKEND